MVPGPPSPRVEIFLLRTSFFKAKNPQNISLLLGRRKIFTSLFESRIMVTFFCYLPLFGTRTGTQSYVGGAAAPTSLPLAPSLNPSHPLTDPIPQRLSSGGGSSSSSSSDGGDSGLEDGAGEVPRRSVGSALPMEEWLMIGAALEK